MRQRYARIGRIGFGVVLSATIVWAILAFATFIDTINTLSVPENPTAQGIVVVTGGSARIEVALELLQSGAANRLLISGVHETTSAQTLARRTRSDPSVFACCVDLDHVALDTAGNAREAANWVQSNAFSSLIVVTSAYHIPRTTREIQHRLPDVDLIAFPIDPATGDHRATDTQHTSWPMGLLAREFVKFQLVRVRHLAERVR